MQPETLTALPVLLPPLPEQRAIAAVLDGLDASIERHRIETGVLHSLKASAADALLTGRVGVGGTMEIHVRSGGWGEISDPTLELLLRNISSHLLCHLREPIDGRVIVRPTLSTKDDPITLYRSSPQDPHIIQLQARNNYWCRFAYQFAHEICHVLSGYERLADNPNGWFHEALCELASVFVLRRMAERWATSPPFLGRTDYAESLASYADDLLSREAHQLPIGATFSTWLASEEGSLRQDRYIRNKNAVVAYQLLPIFESDPAGWNAILKLPNFPGGFRDYLVMWYSQVEEIDNPFMSRIIQRFRE